MTAYFRCSGSISSELVTDMSAAFDDAFGTSGGSYPVKEWADFTNLLGPIPKVTKSGVDSVSFSDALTRPLTSLKFKLTDTYGTGYSSATMQVHHTEGGSSVQRNYQTLFVGRTLQGGTLDAVNKRVIDPLVKFDFSTASINSRLGNSDICVIYTIGASDMYIQPYKADGDVVKCNVLPTLPSISLQETITEGVSADSGALKISIECDHLTGDLETADGRKQALLDWISSNSAVVLVSPRDTKPGHTPIVVPCWDNLTDQTDPSTGANAYELTAATPTDSVTVEYWLDISTLGG